MAQRKAKVGRPRRNPRRLTRQPREEIIIQASRLFAEQGYANTTTRQIAEASGLQQPSLFHYFSTKEDILVELSQRALERPVQALAAIRAGPGSAPAKLFAIIRFHTHHLCAEPVYLRAVIDAVKAPGQRFRKYAKQVSDYSHGIQALIEAGVTSGEFLDLDPTLASMAIHGQVNWTIRWFDRNGPRSPEEVADTFARFALRGLLVAPDKLDAYVEEAGALSTEPINDDSESTESP